MANKQEIQQCIDMCTQAANTLRSAANAIPSSASREMATLGAGQVIPGKLPGVKFCNCTFLGFIG